MSEKSQSQAVLCPVLEDDVIMCPHGGRVQLKSVKGKSFESGDVPVILEPDMQNALISGCTNSILGVPSPSSIKLKRIKWRESSNAGLCKPDNDR